jgi:hypothetical protein
LSRPSVLALFSTTWLASASASISLQSLSPDPQFRLFEAWFILRTIGIEFLTPWRVEQFLDFFCDEFLSQFRSRFSRDEKQFFFSAPANVLFFRNQNISWQDEPTVPR